jgi:hypothetical protein
VLPIAYFLPLAFRCVLCYILFITSSASTASAIYPFRCNCTHMLKRSNKRWRVVMHVSRSIAQVHERHVAQVSCSSDACGLHMYMSSPILSTETLTSTCTPAYTRLHACMLQAALLTTFHNHISTAKQINSSSCICNRNSEIRRKNRLRCSATLQNNKCIHAATSDKYVRCSKHQKCSRGAVFPHRISSFRNDVQHS